MNNNNRVAQPNITSVGTLTGLEVDDKITIKNGNDIALDIEGNGRVMRVGFGFDIKTTGVDQNNFIETGWETGIGDFVKFYCPGDNNVTTPLLTLRGDNGINKVFATDIESTKFIGPLQGNVTGNVDGIVGGSPAAVTGTTTTVNTGFSM